MKKMVSAENIVEGEMLVSTILSIFIRTAGEAGTVIILLVRAGSFFSFVDNKLPIHIINTAMGCSDFEEWD